MNEKSIDRDAVLSAPKKSLYANRPLLLAGIVAILSYASIRLIHPFHMELQDTLILVGYILLCVICIHMSFPLKKRHYIQISFTLACCIPNAFYTDYFLKVFNLAFIMIQLAAFMQDASHKQISKDHRHYILINLVHAVLLNPLMGLRKAVIAVLRSIRNVIQIRHLLFILAGCLLSIPVLFIVFPLLISADDSFHLFMRELFYIFMDMDQFLMEIIYVIAAIFLFSYLYPLIYAHIFCERHDIVKTEPDDIDLMMKRTASTPPMILMTMEIILIIVYALFLYITAQKLILYSNFSLTTFSYSMFARQGFFELCMISSINAVVISGVQLFTKDKTSNIFIWIKYILCMETILIILTAMTKMLLYIQAYGLTPLRVYSSWFMLVLLMAFLFIIYHTKHHPRLLMYHIVLCFSCSFFILNIINTSAIIDHFNQNITSVEDIFYE